MSYIATSTVDKTVTPKVGYRRRMVGAAIFITIAVLMPLYTVSTILDTIFPSFIPDFIVALKWVAFNLFLTKTLDFNTKTFCILIWLFLCGGSGIFLLYRRWALWVCGREEEKFPLFTFMPNFLYSKYAAERYDSINKEAVIKKLESELLKLKKEKEEASNYVARLENMLTISHRDVRSFMNLDRLIAKCYRELFLGKSEPYEQLRYMMCSVCAEISSTTDDIKHDKQVYIFLRDFTKNKLVLIGDHRGGTHLDNHLSFSEGQGFVGNIWGLREDRVIPDIDADESGLIEKSEERRYNSIAGKQILHENELVGVIVIASQTTNAVSDKDFVYISRYMNLIKLILLIFHSSKDKGGVTYENFLEVIRTTKFPQVVD